MFFSPLEQFTLEFFVFNDSFFFFFNNFVHVLVYFSFVFCLFMYFNKKFIISGNNLYVNVFTFLYKFIFNIVRSQTLGKGDVYFPFFFYLFVFVFFCNIFGMFPFTLTLTSHIFLTFAISFVLFIGMNSIAFHKFGMHFFEFFLPKGVPFVITPFLTLIELISYIFRLFSVGIRLFANMTSGHVLMKILAGFAWTLFSLSLSSNLFFIANLFLIAVIFVLIILECAIAFLQSYVLLVLNCIYLKDALLMSH